jgi:hypothetical protein
MVRINCPPDCVYLDSNTDYQQKRAGDRFAQERRDFYKRLFELGGEPAAALFNLIEVTAFGHFHNRRDGYDAEVIAGVQTLRRTLSPIHIPAGAPAAFGEDLKREYEAFMKQPQSPARLDQQTATEVLDLALQFMTDLSGSGLHSQRFLTGLLGYIKAYHPDVAEQVVKQGHQGGRILLPDQVPLSSLPRSGHLHDHPHPPHVHHR